MGLSQKPSLHRFAKSKPIIRHHTPPPLKLSSPDEISRLETTFQEVSDDNFAISLPTRLVSVAALLRRYSPSPHPLLRLLSHVPALASSDQSYLRAKLSTLHDFVQGDQVGP
jgi:hypothetical protein